MNEVSKGNLKQDKHQLSIVRYLDKMINILHSQVELQLEGEGKVPAKYTEQNFLSKSLKNAEDVKINVSQSSKARMKGIYIYGEVGTGKTMLMDIFYKECRVPKLRIHFHQFMLNTHKEIFDFNQSLLKKYGRDTHLNLSSERDAIAHVARSLALKTKVLCLDEFQVTDICDALILLKVFKVLWEHGTILVTTSNRAPDDLYQNGLNRHYFTPFINRLKEECIVKQISSRYDYRSEMIENKSQVFFYPCSNESMISLKSLFESDLANTSHHPRHISMDSPLPVSVESIPIMMGRSWTISKCCLIRRICWLDFSDVCETERGAADYRALCDHFSIIYINSIPILNVLNHDASRRFITFIDEVYDAKVRLVWSSAKPPNQLFEELIQDDDSMNGEVCSVDAAKTALEGYDSTAAHARGDNTGTYTVRQVVKTDTAEEVLSELLVGELASVKELGFAFRRAASRLTEMASEQYYFEWKETLLMRKFEN